MDATRRRRRVGGFSAPSPTKLRQVLAAALASVLTLGLAACDGSGAQAVGDTEAQTGYVSGSGTVTRVPAGERKDVPDLQGETLDGDQVSLDDFTGQTVVLNVWGSWCPPCRKEAPELAAASRALADREVAFLGISTRDRDPAAAKAFERRFDMPYPSLYDPAGELLLAFRETLPPNAIPSTLVIDSQGRVAARVIGETTEATLVGLVEDVLDAEES